MDLTALRKFSFELTKIEPVLQDVLGLSPISKAEFQATHDGLQDRWYAAFDRAGDPKEQTYDYSVYADPLYPHLMLDCFKGWSRGNAVNVATFFAAIEPRMKRPLKTLLDVFAGLGQTSVLLAKAFPKTTIFLHGTDPAQLAVAQELKKRFNTPNVELVSEVQPATAVFAMEAMEHVLDPLAFITPVLKDKATQFYIDGSSFTIDSIGHFPIYLHGETPITNDAYKRFYFDQLKKLGYYQSFDSKRWVHKRFYNGRPNALVREGAVK